MNVVFDDNLKPWQKFEEQDCTIYLAGNIFLDGELFAGRKAAQLIKNKFLYHSVDTKKMLSLILEGQFSFILETSLYTFCFVDKIRSFPIYYANCTRNLAISNNARKLVKNFSDINEEGLLEFSMAGYTIGSKTLFNNLFQLCAGEFLFYDKFKNQQIINKYFNFSPDNFNKQIENNFINELDLVLDKSIEKLIKIARGRKIVLALSAGLDSRLILAKTLQSGYNNILCYTYGPNYLWEIKEAESIALAAKIPWVYVEFNHKSKEKFNTDKRKDYYLNYSGLNSIPHLADFYALDILSNEMNINLENCIITNGQTGDFISGGHIPQSISAFTENELINYIIDKHFGLWNNLHNDRNTNYLIKLLKKYISPIVGSGPPTLANKLEYFECQERQFKYVINGQRAYDYYGLEWYLPLWSDEMICFWLGVNLESKLDQRLYKTYCKIKNPLNLFPEVIQNSKYSLPKKILPFYFLSKLFDRVFKRNYSEAFKRRYFNFFSKYAPYYPQQSYLEFIKDSKYHRHCVSYWIKYFLQENNLN